MWEEKVMGRYLGNYGGGVREAPKWVSDLMKRCYENVEATMKKITIEKGEKEVRKGISVHMFSRSLPSWSLLLSQTGGLLSCSRGVLSGVVFGTAPFSTSVSSLSLASYLPDSMQGMPDKDVPPVPTNGILEFNKWYEGFISEPHSN
jgi:hypothetical protein